MNGLTSRWRRASAAGSLALAALLSGCAVLQAPAYSPSLQNVDALKRSGASGAAVGAFSVVPDASGAASIGLRGAPMASSVGGDYAAYLAEALRRELALAGKLDPSSAVTISGTLLKNDISAAGLVTNSGEIEARFRVHRGGVLRFDAVKRAELQWDSSFAGAIAIPKAQQQYPQLVSKLIAELLADPAFFAAWRD